VTVVLAGLDAAAELVERLSVRFNALVNEGFSPRDSARRIVNEMETFRQQAAQVHASLADAVFLSQTTSGDSPDLISIEELLQTYMPR
jgi:hypothetical protein